MQNRLTQKAENALQRSLAAAEDLGHTYVGTEHLLIGLAEEEDSAAARILDAKGVTSFRIREAVREIGGEGSRTRLSPADMTPRTKAVIEIAGTVADEYSGGFVGTEHLLAAICREKDCTGCRVLVSLSADPGQIAREVGQVCGAAPAKTEKRPPEPETADLPNLNRYGVDLTAAAKAGRIDPVIGRETETARVIAILCRKTKNNPCLVGEPGVGKTAVVEGLAHRIASGEVPELLSGRRIVTLDLSSLVAGAKYRGEFEERMRGVIDEAAAHPEIILFIDEVHSLVGAGAAEGAVDAANILKPALARGAIRLIGATTPDEYARHIERDSALERRFQRVTVSEPDKEQTLAILKGVRDRFEAHHGVTIPDETLDAAVSLSVRYLSDKYLPDKAIDLIDEGAARLRLSSLPRQASVRDLERESERVREEMENAVRARNFELAATLRDRERALDARRERLKREGEERPAVPTLTRDDLAAVLSERSGIPFDRVTDGDRPDRQTVTAKLAERIVGQSQAVEAVARAVCRGRLGLSDARRPVGSFLFLGPTGVGKTELSRALAETVFGSPSALLRFDMSEYKEPHSISRLIGSPPGYVGHEEGGQLSEKLRRQPYSVVLFDEVEKADREVLGILLQMMDDGSLTDGRGRKVDCRNCILILTSNLGASYQSDGRKIGFSDSDDRPSDKLQVSSALREVRRFFPPEFLNRLDEIITFRRLGKDDLAVIARHLLCEAAERAKGAGVELTWDEGLPALIAEKGADADAGARPMRRYLTRSVEDPLADLILSSEIPPKTVRIGIEDGKPKLYHTEKEKTPF